ncbi:MAG TPA: Flp family type IVb pilin [Sphingomonas sp.]
MRRIRKLASDQKGGTLIEYGLILALVVIAMMVAIQTFATQVVGTLNHVSNEVVHAGDA